jgi:ectoine hydroxylase-related dioxygenase (phytanoyl-CoA dioxygenase family)
LEQLHVKLSFYLDPLDADSGAIRLIPGTNDWTSAFATQLRSDLATPDRVQQTLGVRWDEVPSWPLATVPGDLVVWNFRVIHASFGGSERRRLFSMNFREPAAAAS